MASQKTQVTMVQIAWNKANCNLAVTQNNVSIKIFKIIQIAYIELIGLKRSQPDEDDLENSVNKIDMEDNWRRKRKVVKFVIC